MKLTSFKTIILVLFGVAALVGLFVFATHTSNTSSNSGGIGTAVIWGTLPGTQMQQMLTLATKADQSLKDVSYVQKDPATLPIDLASAIATGNAPDLVLANQEELHAIAKLLAPIPTATLPPATFSSAFIGEGKLLATPAGDGYYGVPFVVDPLVLFSNHAILSSDGVAKPPSTWEALTGLVPTVASLTSTKQITRGLIALGTYDNVHNARAILSSLYLQTSVPVSAYGGGNLLSANLHAAPSDPSSFAGHAVLAFYTQFADPSKVSYTWNASLPDSQQAFISGDLALYPGFASEARYLQAANPNLDFTVSTLPQPATASAKSTYGLLYSFMLPRGGKNASGAYAAAALFSTSAMQAIAAPALGLAPASVNALGTLPSDQTASVAYAEALYSQGWLSPLPSLTDSVFSSMINGVISGRLTIDTALTSGENALSAELQK
jgi:ABC-type glycerol-3-phosphate transport system substrate-binding protein